MCPCACVLYAHSYVNAFNHGIVRSAIWLDNYYTHTLCVCITDRIMIHLHGAPFECVSHLLFLCEHTLVGDALLSFHYVDRYCYDYHFFFAEKVLIILILLLSCLEWKVKFVSIKSKSLFVSFFHPFMCCVAAFFLFIECVRMTNFHSNTVMGVCLSVSLVRLRIGLDWRHTEIDLNWIQGL